MAVLRAVRWYHGPVLICISPIVSDAEHLFRCFIWPPGCLLWTNAHLDLWSIELHELFSYFGDKFLVSKFSSKLFSPDSEGFFFLVWFTVSLPVQKFLRLEKLNSTKPQKLLRLEKINSFVEF